MLDPSHGLPPVRYPLRTGLVGHSNRVPRQCLGSAVRRNLVPNAQWSALVTEASLRQFNRRARSYLSWRAAAAPERMHYGAEMQRPVQAAAELSVGVRDDPVAGCGAEADGGLD